MTKIKFPKIIFFFLAVMFFSCQRNEKSNKSSKVNDPPAPVSVRLLTSRTEKFPKEISASGTLAPDDMVSLGFQISGVISNVFVDMGTRVKKGAELARLDTSDINLRIEETLATVNEARANLGLEPGGENDEVDPEETPSVKEANVILIESKSNLDRDLELNKTGLISQAEVESSTSKYQVALNRYKSAIDNIKKLKSALATKRVQLMVAKKAMTDSILLSPIDGTISGKKVSVGELVSSGSITFTIVKDDPLRLRMAIPERESRSIEVGQTVKVAQDGDKNEYAGIIARISPVIDEKNRTLSIEAEIPNKSGKLRPGTFVVANIMVKKEENVIIIPASAIITFAGLEKVLLIKEGKSSEKQIRTGRKFENNVEVLEGLNPGEDIITEPGNLAGGQPVVVVR